MIAEGVNDIDHCLRNIKCIALGGLEHGHGDRRITILTDGLLAEGIEAVGGFAHILEPQQVALGGLANDQAIEILNRDQITVVLNNDWIGKPLITTSRRAAHQTTNRHSVLVFDGRHNLVGRELVCGQLGRIDEQPEGWIATPEQVDAGHARHPFQLVIEIFVDQAVEVGRVVLTFR